MVYGEKYYAGSLIGLFKFITLTNEKISISSNNVNHIVIDFFSDCTSSSDE